MNQDEIIEMAIQGHASTRDAIRWAMNQEREACAKVCEEINTKYKCPNDTAEKVAIEWCVAKIRVRGET